MDRYSVVPPAVLENFIAAQSSIISDIVKGANIPRVSMMFISETGFFIHDPRLIHDPGQRFQHSKWNQGISGMAILNNQTTAWPDTKGSGEHRLNAEPLSSFEIATPIRLDGRPAGVLLATYLRQELPSIKKKKEQTARLEFEAERVSALLDASTHDEPAREEIRELIRSAIKITKSKRGYVALKRNDGSISYVTDKDSETDVFLRLNLSEGLTGRALREGKIINLGNVWEDDDYVPSDHDINSELLIPLSIDGSHVAVLNLEANPPKHYDAERENLAKSIALKLKQLISKLIKLTPVRVFDQEIVLSFIEEVEARISRNKMNTQSQISDFIDQSIRTSLQDLFPGEDLIEWNGRDGLAAPPEFAGTKWSNNIERGSIESEKNGKWVVFSPYRREGHLNKLYGFSSSSPRSIRDAKTMRSICRFAEIAYRDQVGRYLDGKFRDLIDKMLSKTNLEVSLMRALEEIAEILRLDAVTVFSNYHDEMGDRLVPVATTSASLSSSNNTEEYYLVDPKDGLTGFVAATQELLVLQSVGNKQERSEVAGPIKPIWKKKIAENGADHVQSFIGAPLLSVNGNKLIGIVRGHRLQRNALAPFSDVDIERFKILSSLMSRIYEDVISEAKNV